MEEMPFTERGRNAGGEGGRGREKGHSNMKRRKWGLVRSIPIKP